MSRFIGHYAPWILATVVGSLIALTLLPVMDASASMPLLMLVFVATVFLGITIFAHNRRLCERCIRAVPLDASTVAHRQARRFRVAHLFERRSYAVIYLGALVACSLLYSDPIGRYAWAAAQATLVYLLLAYVTHQRLQPWCPYCRNGGEDQKTPTPTAPLSSQH